MTAETLIRTPLYKLHHEHGAKFVPFAGYEMPVQYASGVLAEHLHTRSAAGLFDVSHMGQATLMADDGRHETVAAALETLVAADIIALAPGHQRYTQLLQTNGGIIDDLMVSRPPDQDGQIGLVVNASRKAVDYAVIAAALPDDVKLVPHPERALLALQGPKAGHVLGDQLGIETGNIRFMQTFCAGVDIDGSHIELAISRSGYTGEDGFEISCHQDDGMAVARRLLDHNDVLPIGLGARDSLRLEAGMPLYGNDIDETTSPVEADLAFSIGKARRRGGAREGGFPGAERILRELDEGPSRKRIGLIGEGRAPMRAGTELFSTDAASDPVGTITSGCFGPSVEAAISMAYVPPEFATPETRLFAEVRGKRLPAAVVALPFYRPNYKR